MNKLLSAEFIRLFKSLVFKLCLLFSAGLAVLISLLRYADVKKNADFYAQYSSEYVTTDGLIFVGALYLIFAFAALIGIFIGTEYHDGTLRNKLTAGHTRCSIYLSKLLVCVGANVMIHVLFLLLMIALRIVLFHGAPNNAVSTLLQFGAASSAAVAALTALLLLLSMLIPSKAVGSVACLLTAVVMLFATLTIYNKLAAPEYYYEENGTTFAFYDEETKELNAPEASPVKNPGYLAGSKRKFFEFLNDFLPVSQLYQIAQKHPDDLGMMAVYDGVILIAAAGVGMAIFKKKNLK
ncbi:MAG: ABC transporter permease subunit [Lachnospiraceae bacterium]|nr:ABC transporter permease subunit [Lachnospiraceae bacterium]